MKFAILLIYKFIFKILNKLFKNKKDIGLDLLSIDILRGRDHGIPAYHKYRNICKMKSKIEVFDDLYPHIPQRAIVELRESYKSVYDIDLIVGGSLEVINGIETDDYPDDLGFLGPTFSCIIAEQFKRFKVGDAYFYTHQNQTSPHKFTEGNIYD